MSIRIYALAKELKMNGIDVRALCSKLNINLHGGGSALTSISDEEAARIRQYVASLTSVPDVQPCAEQNVRLARVPRLPSLGKRGEGSGQNACEGCKQKKGGLSDGEVNASEKAECRADGQKKSAKPW